MSALIPGPRFREFAPRSAYEQWAPALSWNAERVGITSTKRISHWLGQLHCESAGFTRFEEDLNYRTPSRLDAMFSAVHGEQDAAALIIHGPQAIANRVYSNRGGNGDEASGDGWRFRGRGCLMTTFRDGYTKAAKWTGLDLLADPDQLLMPVHSAKVAADYWRVCDLNDEADAGDIVEITRAINGPALAGLDERKRETARALRIFGAA